MTIVVDETDYGVEDSSSPAAYTHTVASGDTFAIIFVWTRANNNVTSISGVTFGGSNATLAVTSPTSVRGFLKIYWIKGISAGSNSVSVTFSGGDVPRATVYSYSMTGVDEDDPIRGVVSDSGSGTQSTDTIASAINDLVFGAVLWKAQGGSTADSPATELVTFNVGSSANEHEGTAAFEAGESSVTMEFTGNTSRQWSTALVSMKPAPEAPAGGGFLSLL